VSLVCDILLRFSVAPAGIDFGVFFICSR